ncbi:hypothetical protein ACFVT1_40500 [Streptomyces sp. NPDC057963]|uniref:hypothetical protein n=1 Tax=Streptomyces sp. NPDC057963 TaxID=3346290 RepID=UPI0036DFF00F
MRSDCTTADILGHDIRIGRRGTRPGLGFGGGCVPKDLGGFITRADELDADEDVGMACEAGAVKLGHRGPDGELPGGSSRRRGVDPGAPGRARRRSGAQ